MHSNPINTSGTSGDEEETSNGGRPELSESALQQHESSLVEDHNHPEGVIRAEATRSYYRASASYRENNGTSTDSSPATSSPINGLEASMARGNGTLDRPFAEEIGRIQRLHRPSPSNATPMERFAHLAPSEDPYRPNAERALSDIGIDYGSLQQLDTRHDAAKTLAAGVQPAKKKAVSDSMASSLVPIAPRPETRSNVSKRRAGTPASEGRYGKRPRDAGD